MSRAATAARSWARGWCCCTVLNATRLSRVGHRLRVILIPATATFAADDWFLLGGDGAEGCATAEASAGQDAGYLTSRVPFALPRMLNITCWCCLMTLNKRGELSFFFQAEDGIRDLTVTGVQTCALPI